MWKVHFLSIFCFLCGICFPTWAHEDFSGGAGTPPSFLYEGLCWHLVDLLTAGCWLLALSKDGSLPISQHTCGPGWSAFRNLLPFEQRGHMDCPQRNFSCCITNTHFILLAVQIKHISGKPNCDLRWSGLCAAQSVPTFLWRSWKYRFPWKSRAGRDMRKLLPQWQLPSSTHWKPPAAQGVPGLQKHRGPTKPLASCIGN